MDQYTQLPKKLGKGSCGTVTLVQRNSDGQLFAMKMTDIDLESTSKSPYENEQAIHKKLQHPNIIKFYETFTTNEYLCIIMEYCENGDLLQKIKEAKASNSWFSEEEILNWFCQLCLAVKYLHDNHIIHRDIKVHNIFLTSGGLVKLGDFGISKQLENTADLSQTHTGTPLYLTPEMILHSTSSYKSDVWMLGCLLYELCSLKKPFKGDSFPEVIHQIIKKQPDPIPDRYSPSLHKLVEILLEKDLDKRPSIYSVLAMPEIFKQTQLLKLKHPEVYNTRFMFGQDLRKTEKELRKAMSSDNNDVLLAKAQSNPIDGSKSAVPVISQLSPSGSHVDSRPTKALSNRPTLTDIPEKLTPDGKAENMNFLSPKTRRSNNIWSLVQQKRDNNVEIQKFPHSTTAANKPVKIFEDELIKSPTASTASTTVNQTLVGKKSHTNEKEEGARKTHRLSIRIPGTSPDQSQGKEFKCAETTREATTKRDGVNLPMRDHSNDSNTVATAKTVTKKEFAFSHLIFDNKSPVSPNRSMWVPQFLKSKLGNEKYEQVLGFLETSNNPLEILKDQPELVLEIIGESNKDCLVMLSFLMAYNSNSATPTGDWEKNKDKIPVKSPNGSRKLFMKMPKKINPPKSTTNEKKQIIAEVKK